MQIKSAAKTVLDFLLDKAENYRPVHLEEWSAKYYLAAFGLQALVDMGHFSLKKSDPPSS